MSCRVVTLRRVPSTSTNSITRLKALFFLNLFARVRLCRPRDEFPPDRLVRRKSSWSLPPPLDAARCAPPVYEEG